MNNPLVLAVETTAPADGAGPARPSLSHCVLLAALLHLWLVALVGTAPGGAAAPGDGVWSAIQIRLTGSGPVDSPGQAPSPLPHSGPTGRAPEPRFGGTVPQALPRPSPEPGAAELGHWNTRPSPAPAEPAAAPARPGADPAPTPAPPPVLTRTPPQAPERREEPLAPPATAPAVPAPPARPATDAAPAPSTAPRLAPADTVEAPVLERPSQALRDIANPAATPSAAARPQPAPAPQREDRVLAPAPVQPRAVVQPARPLPLPDAAVPLAAPVPLTLPPTLPPTPTTPAPLPAPIPVTAPTPEPARAAEPPSEAPAAPAPTPAPPPAPSFAVEPRPAPRIAPVRPIDIGPSARGTAPDLALPPVRAAEPTVTAPAAAQTATPSAPARDSLLPALPPVPAAGPQATSARPGSERAAAPAAAASAAPLNLDLQRARAPLPGLATPRALNLVPPPPERKSALTEGIEKAAKPDCRKAYAGMGVLGALPLAADAVRDGGCRW